MKNDEACRNCKGGLHCYNGRSQCYGTWCGIYPGTGPWYDSEKERGKRQQEKK